ncbi:hypothetical protein HAX54_003342 [Datura stramonium]|uniref:Uncharacterized protein n=1 Tax=Datura stramonium TaxID=4076 RepID=A0ABS8WUJ7_DATST|nr:hypothetical protein [Datura stramonium]
MDIREEQLNILQSEAEIIEGFVETMVREEGGSMEHIPSPSTDRESPTHTSSPNKGLRSSPKSSSRPRKGLKRGPIIRERKKKMDETVAIKKKMFILNTLKECEYVSKKRGAEIALLQAKQASKGTTGERGVIQNL